MDQTREHPHNSTDCLLSRLALLLALLGTAVSCAAADRPLYSRFHALIGGFFPTVATQARLNAGHTVEGTQIDFESELGLEGNVASPRLGLLWRITRRSGISASYFQLNRDGTDTASIDIKWGDISIPADAPVYSKMDTEVLTLSYTYAFVQRPKWELAVSGGLHVTRFEATIQRLDDPAQTDGGTVTAPLPVVGLVGGFDFGKRWTMLGKSRFFALDVGDYKGRILELSAFAQYAFSKHVGIAAGLDFFETDLESEDDGFQGEIQWSYFGPGVYLTFF